MSGPQADMLSLEVGQRASRRCPDPSRADDRRRERPGCRRKTLPDRGAGRARARLSTRTRRTVPARRHGSTTLELSCSRCLDGSQCPWTRAFDVLYLPVSRSIRRRRGRSATRSIDTAFYQDGVIDLRQLVREQLLPAAADEAAVPRRLPGPVPDVRHEPEHRRLRVRTTLGRSPAGAARKRSVEESTTMPNPKRRHSKTRGQAPHPRRARAGPARPVPAVPRAQAAAPVCPNCGYYKGGRSGRSTRRNRQPADAVRLLRDRRPIDLHRRPIAVDAMGGDHAPAPIVDGAVAAARHLPRVSSSSGRRESHRRRARAARGCGVASRSTIVDAPDVVGMAESPAQALRRKPRASIRVAGRPWRDGARGGRRFSAGNTGATVMAAYAALGLLPGVRSPGAGDRRFRRRAARAVLLDAGANVECRPQHLLQFAVMGIVYAQLALGIAAAARRAALDRRGRDEGQRADARGAPRC